jgi:hypothetical protein
MDRMGKALGVLCAAIVLAACGGSSSSQWKGLRSVRVTVAQPGLPPPYGMPKTTAFTTSGELARVTSLLNAHHIAQASSTASGAGCAGGFRIQIVIARTGSAPAELSAYQCANQTSGNVSGDLVGFLKAIGVNV